MNLKYTKNLTPAPGPPEVTAPASTPGPGSPPEVDGSGGGEALKTPGSSNLAHLDHAHIWHPFTPMRQWRESQPLIIDRGEAEFLIDINGNRYIDGISSMWCNVHGHNVPEINNAIKAQLDRIAHTSIFGQTHPQAIELAKRLSEITPGQLNKVFFSDSGATALEIAFKMAIGYHYNTGQPQRDTFIAIEGAYHGDTTGSMSVGYSETFHRPFKSMVFHTEFVSAPDCFHSDIASGCCQRSQGAISCKPAAKLKPLRRWSTQCENTNHFVCKTALLELDQALTRLGDKIAAIVIEPIIQGAAGIITQPHGYISGVAELAKKHNILLIADEVATGFGRTGKMFACQHENVTPDIICLAKGITGGYLPLAATLCTDQIEQAFCGEINEHKTLYHGHTYTANPLACAAALASLDLFEKNDLINEVNRKAELLADWLSPLRDPAKYPNVADVRQRGLIAGIELINPETGESSTGFDPSRRLGHDVCNTARKQGVLIRPLGNVVYLIPPLAIKDENLKHLAQVVIESITLAPGPPEG